VREGKMSHELIATKLDQLIKMTEFFNQLMTDILKARPDFKEQMEDETADYLGLGPWDLVLKQMKEDAESISKLTDRVLELKENATGDWSIIKLKNSEIKLLETTLKTVQAERDCRQREIEMLKARLGDTIDENKPGIDWRRRCLRAERCMRQIVVRIKTYRKQNP
jgi:hypothetical protein